LELDITLTPEQDLTGIRSPAAGAAHARFGHTIPSPSAVAESALDLICTHDFDGRILSVNAAACEALGVSSATLRRMTIPQLLSPRAASEFPAYVENVRQAGFAVALMRVTTQDGSSHVLECRSALNAAGIIRSVGRDVTEREEALREARYSEEHFRSIIENVSDIIAIVEMDGSIRYGSPSVTRVLGYPRDVLYGLHAIDMIHPDDAGRAAEFLRLQMAEHAANQSIELRARHQDGSWRSFEIVATNLVKNGAVKSVILNARDISERKLLEAQLLQANRLSGLGRLAATVAHEFNNVLMGMQPFAELLQRPDATPEMISKGAWHIGNSIKRGKRIVLDILRFAQPHVPVTTSVDLGEWWETFAPEAEAVLADRGQLSQVMTNLVANARDAMAAGGTLTVSAGGLQPNTRFPFGALPHPEKFVQISIHDSGTGIPNEIMDRVFEPLFTTKQSGGTGLGLAVAHQVMTQHGGYIFAESEAGCGTTFHLFLIKGMPASCAPAKTPVINWEPAAKKVLIVDDEPSIVDGIAALLEQDGFDVDSATSGGATIDAIARFHPDVVLLDFGLPDMDGSEVYERIREQYASLPVIFATGHGDRRVLLDRLDDPQIRFLQKPFDVAKLLETMADLENGSKR
jgi:PAS domain S-box-containing protein